ncbi:MAG: hypothetical protein IPI09_20230 [Burkholderiales bacterium]|nr:hypothetical protein [Burkholderiales bacterium]
MRLWLDPRTTPSLPIKRAGAGTASWAWDNQRFLWGILETLSHKENGNTANQHKIGDYFAACMDEATVETRGATPMQPVLDEIAAMRSKADLPAVLAKLHLSIADNGLYFGFGSDQDFSNSSNVIAFATGGGLSLPDRDYYTKLDTKSKVLRAKYLAHVARMFALMGEASALAQQHAATVLRTETTLARATLSVVDKRDPYKLFHKMDLIQLQALTPGFDWGVYLKAAGLADVSALNATEPRFCRAMARHWKNSSLDDIKVYLRWQWHMHRHQACRATSSPRTSITSARLCAGHRCSSRAGSVVLHWWMPSWEKPWDKSL